MMRCLPIFVNGILGESVVLPHEGIGTFQRMTWSAPDSRKDSASGGSEPLAVVRPGALGVLPHFTVENERYRGRVRLQGQSYSLEISNLTMADQGEYKLISLSVHMGRCRRLSTPEISVSSAMSGNSTCNVTFTCSTGERDQLHNYTWTRPAGDAILSTEGSLLVLHRLGDEDSPVTCTVRNRVSSSSASASPKVACPAPPQAVALSYCHAKGILLLGVLGTLLAGILTVHVLTARGQRQS
uniref:Ig-like domain-containing protein n=1 Tax=Pelusios castaneus TaxID=367368 RepID=A0A8C8RPT4_9SAUR